ncbi:hypothetical protein TanjilG_23738 [Lupinus angustifolius]|uniref:Serine aminopeptidase S33 domain-containing protein n=1 Tax=Lupinus angustifolius TaxID=3871 RepID=A0A1J7FMZ2_LUPAN|nr:hypothetical protein TanjilG_23738 [Lupinus angustifolius]
MIEQFINFIIRPPRVSSLKFLQLVIIGFKPIELQLQFQFIYFVTHTGRTIIQISTFGIGNSSLQLKNGRGYTLQCSHYLPLPFPEDTSLPCVIYCHGNSGCRADANEAAVILLPSNITVFTLDFSGSGLSDGDYVSLGWHEKDDLKIVVSYLRSNKQITQIGLWGRSMGAVTSLLYGAEDPSIAGMILDSAFSNLYGLMMELVDVYKIRLPKFTNDRFISVKWVKKDPVIALCLPIPSNPQLLLTWIVQLFMKSNILLHFHNQVKMAVQYMRRVIEKKAKFDIRELNCLLVAPKTFIPVLFGHASDDKFIQPHHSDLISESYAGDKNVIKFDGDHNSSRPQFFYDSVSIFFNNVLHPPHVSRADKLDKYYDLGDLKLGSGVDENLLYEILSSMRSATTDDASSSSGLPTISATKSVSEPLSEDAPVTDAKAMFREVTMHVNNDAGHDEPTNMQEKVDGEIEECWSYTSSNRGSWGRCSSLGGSDEEELRAEDSLSQKTVNVYATPMRRKEEEKNKNKKKNKKKGERDAKKGKSEKFEKLEALSRRLRQCLLKGSSTHTTHNMSFSD